MTLEDYINSIRKPAKRKFPEDRFTATELSCYDNISEEKKELIRSAFSYLNDYLFMDVFDRYEKQVCEYAYYQYCTNEGLRVLIRIKVCDLIGFPDVLRPIPENRFYEEYNRCSKIGSQKYADVKILAQRDQDDPNYDYYIKIFYMYDGSVFLDSTAANVIKNMKVNDLGKYLAKVCIECIEKEEKLGYQRVRQ